MKINLTYKEANLLAAILWELGVEGGIVHSQDVWRLSDDGKAICRDISDGLEEANDKHVRKTGKHRDLSGAPKNSILDARWTA